MGMDLILGKRKWGFLLEGFLPNGEVGKRNWSFSIGGVSAKRGRQIWCEKAGMQDSGYCPLHCLCDVDKRVNGTC